MATKSNTQEFVAKAVLVHGNKYTYTKTKYVNKQTKVTITCPTHGDFEQRPNNHLNGYGCSQCGNALTNKGRQLTTAQFITKAREVHGGQYSYSKTVYAHNQVKVVIICPKHGAFEQTPAHHLQGMGCSKCGGSEKGSHKKFITEAIAVHGNRYDYSRFQYVNNKTKGIIICQLHGEFQQSPNSHISTKYGCPKCKHIRSKKEVEVAEFLKSLGITVVESDRSLIAPLTLDVYLPDHQLAIEFNGVIHHSELRKPNDYHWKKSRACADKGVRLIHVWEDDWKHNQSVIEAVLANAIGITPRGPYARKCLVMKVSRTEANVYYEQHHILGACGTSIPEHYALVYKDQVQAVMSFTANSGSQRGKTGTWELIRFVNHASVTGAAGKLFRAFLEEHNPERVLSYSDNDYFSGGVYSRLGFQHIGDVRPDYKVLIGGVRRHKSTVRKARLAIMFPKCDITNQTEHQICLENNIYRVYDSGKKKWEWRRQLFT